MQYRIHIFIILFILVLDQISKQLALVYLSGQVIGVIPGLFELRLAFNTGVAFSMFGDFPPETMRWVLAGFAVVVSVGLSWWMTTQKTTLAKVGIAMIIAGALGNAIDRVHIGAVVDFLSVYDGIFGTYYHFPIFNIADSSIALGVLAVLADSLTSDEETSTNNLHEK